MQFNADGSVDARSCLLALVPDPAGTWQWRFSGDGLRVVLHCRLDDGVSGDIELEVARARDGGFLLFVDDLVLCSREKTQEEHVYRSYSILRYPEQLYREVQGLAGGRLPTPYAFPPTLTSFERLVVHRLAENLGLRHDSRGFGVQRRIVVW